MATVIDALLVKFGFDVSEARQGAKEVANLTAKTTEEMRKSGQKMEQSAKGATDFFGRLRGEILMLFAAFTGGRGLKQFAEDLTQSSAAAGRFARLIGATTGEVGKWTTAGEAFGGTANSISSSISNLNNSLQQISLTGESSVLPYLRALNINLQDGNGNIKTATQLLPELHKSLSAIAATNPGRAAAIGHGLGLSDDMIQLLISTDEQFNKMMADAQRWGQVTEEQSKKAQELQYSWRGVLASFETLGRMIMTTVTPVLVRLNEWLTNIFVWFQKNPTILKAAVAGLTAAIVALGAAMGGSVFAGFAGLLGTIGTALALPIAGVLALVAALAAAAAAVVLLYDDWKTWMAGGKSAFGDFYQYVADHWEDIRGVVNSVIGELKKIWKDYTTVISDELRFIVSLFFGTGEEIRANWGRMMGDMKKLGIDVFEGIVKAVEHLGPLLYDGVKRMFSASFGYIKDRANEVYRAIFGKDLFGKENLDPNATKTASGGYVVGSGGGKIKPVNRDQYEKDIQFFMSQGWTRNQAAGIVASIPEESQGDIHAVGDNGHAFGLMQWHEDRQANFKKVFHKDIRDATREEQLAFIQWELTHTEKSAGDTLRNQFTAEGSGQIVSRMYVRPAAEQLAASTRGRVAEELAKPYTIKSDALAEAVNTATRDYYTPGGPSSAEIAASNDNSRHIHTEIKINKMDINTQATDAKGIAKDIKPELEKQTYGNTANYGYQ